jgi:hypothetical protein
MALIYERFTSFPVAAVTLVDRFVQSRGTQGFYPRPLGAVQFQLIARRTQNGPVGLERPLILRGQTNYTGVYRIANEVIVGGGPVRVIPPGQYRLLITSDFYQDAELDFDWPSDPAAALPGAAGTFR